jgi:transcriptional regulator with XRE-family HTH domain
MYGTRDFRGSYGLTQQEIAKINGVSRIQISRHECNLRKLPTEAKEIFNRIVLLSEIIPDPETLPDIQTGCLADKLPQSLKALFGCIQNKGTKTDS